MTNQILTAAMKKVASAKVLIEAAEALVADIEGASDPLSAVISEMDCATDELQEVIAMTETETPSQPLHTVWTLTYHDIAGLEYTHRSTSSAVIERWARYYSAECRLVIGPHPHQATEAQMRNWGML